MKHHGGCEDTEQFQPALFVFQILKELLGHLRQCYIAPLENVNINQVFKFLIFNLCLSSQSFFSCGSFFVISLVFFYLKFCTISSFSSMKR